jgi:hypothetical protein
MADDDPPALVCLIAGESSPFVVEPKGNISILKLKQLIKENRKNGAISRFDAADLILWKVRMIMGQRQHN